MGLGRMVTLAMKLADQTERTADEMERLTRNADAAQQQIQGIVQPKDWQWDTPRAPSVGTPTGPAFGGGTPMPGMPGMGGTPVILDVNGRPIRTPGGPTRIGSPGGGSGAGLGGNTNGGRIGSSASSSGTSGGGPGYQAPRPGASTTGVTNSGNPDNYPGGGKALGVLSSIDTSLRNIERAVRRNNDGGLGLRRAQLL